MSFPTTSWPLSDSARATEADKSDLHEPLTGISSLRVRARTKPLFPMRPIVRACATPSRPDRGMLT